MPRGRGACLFHVTCEGLQDRGRMSTDRVFDAVKSLSARTNPSTYVVIAGTNGTYCQAAGSQGRFIAEFRETFGEGLAHWRAAQMGSTDDRPTKVFYRQKCVHGTHPPLGCPLSAGVSDVLTVEDVQDILMHFVLHGERHPAYRWRDVTEKFLKSSPSQGADEEILEIRPGSGRSR